MSNPTIRCPACAAPLHDARAVACDHCGTLFRHDLPIASPVAPPQSAASAPLQEVVYVPVERRSAVGTVFAVILGIGVLLLLATCMFGAMTVRIAN